MQRTEEVKLGGAAMSLSADLSCLQSGGGAEREAALASLEKQLICPICLEIFNKPVVILPCQHNLCRKCANELYQPSLFQPRTTMMLNSGRFRCPSCRHDVVLDRHGVYGLQRNLLVENIIDVYKQEVSNNNTSSPLPPPPPLPAQVTCSDHEGEKVNIYCLTCQVPTCSLCKVFGAHQSCQVAPLTDVYQQKKDELSEGVSLLVAFNEKIQALIDELDETCRIIEENSKTQKQIVCEKFDHMVSVLEERRKVMTQQISSEEEEKTGHTQALVRCYGDSVEANKKLMESAASSMEDPDMAAFVQSSRDLITKVIAANTSCPSETLTPGYENLSRYSFNFSQQERALRSIDFIKVVEDVPEEPEVHLEPEEPKDPLIQNIEQKQYQEPSIQNLESVVEPVKEPVPVLIPPPVEPVQIGAPDPGLVRDSEEPAGEVMLLESEDQDSNEDRSGQMKVEKEEARREVVERCATPDPGKEGNVCPNQDGMSTQQYEGGEAGRRDAPEIHMKEEMDAAFYPGWYKTGSWNRVSPALCSAEETLTKDYEPTDDSLLVAKPEIEAHGAGRAISKPQIQPCGIQDSHPLSEGQAEPPANRPELFPHLQPQQLLPLSTQLHAQPYLPLPQPPHHVSPVETAAEDGVVEEGSEEEEDMQGWVCVPGAVGKSFNLAEEGFDQRTEQICPCLEGGFSESDKETFELSDADKKEQVEDTVDSTGRRLGEGDFKFGEGNETSGCDEISEELSGFRKDAVAEVRIDSLDAEDDDKTHNLMLGDRDVDLNPGSSEFAEIRHEEDENSDKPEDFNPNTETSETEEKITSSVSLQIVTLLFYLLAFLVILQRVWAYIGCFICT